MQTVGDILKQEGINVVLNNTPDNWAANATHACRELLRQTEFVTGEMLRQYCEAKDIRPHHCNAWGALTRTLRTAGSITETSLTRKALDPKGHSRRLVVWRSNLYRPNDDAQKANA